MRPVMRTRNWKAGFMCSAWNLAVALAMMGYPADPAEAADRAVISGRVADISGAILQGAQVRVKPLELTVATNAQGEFSIAHHQCLLGQSLQGKHRLRPDSERKSRCVDDRL